MRHHGRTENAQCEVEHFGVGHDLGGRRKAADHLAPIRVGHGDLNAETHGDDAQQRNDEGFHPAKAELLQVQDQEHVERSDHDADFERNAEDQIEADRRADHFRDVGGDDGDFSQRPEREGDRSRKGIAASLREIAAGSDGETRAERLQHDRHDVGHQRHGQQCVTKLRSTCERGRPVAGVHVADRNKVAGTDEREGSFPDGAMPSDRHAAVNIGKRKLAAGFAPAGCRVGCVHGGSSSQKCRIALHLDQASPSVNAVANHLQ